MVEIENAIKGFKITNETKQIIGNEYMKFVDAIINAIRAYKSPDIIASDVDIKRRKIINKFNPDKDFVGFDPLNANFVPLQSFIEFSIRSSNGKIISDLNMAIDNYDTFNRYFESIVTTAVYSVFKGLNFSYKRVRYGKNKYGVDIYTKDDTTIQVVISIPFMDHIEHDRDKFNRRKSCISIAEGGYQAKASMTINVVAMKVDRK